jgi:hypothetical protein
MGTRSNLYPGPGMVSDYREWFDASRHGDVLVYHVGDLQYDRQAQYDEDKPEERENWKVVVTLNAVADAISYEARKGNLVLTQRRLGESKYEYIATRRNLDQARRMQAQKQSDAGSLLP